MTLISRPYKSGGTMKLNLLILVLLLSGASFAQSKKSAAVHVTSIITEGSSEIKSDHLICLGKGWKKINHRIHSNINDLSTVYPTLFRDLPEGPENCFAPNEAPFGARPTLDKILYLIDESARESLYASVALDGSAVVPTEENTDLLRNQHAPLGKKLLRAELLVGGAEAIGMGILILLPKSITKWDDDWVSDSKRSLKRAWTTPPVWDKDEWVINYIGHPLSGAVYYNALRSQGATRLQSFLFSTVQSTFWEYAVEAIAERPSIQDLVITPIVGSVIGELSHQATLRLRQGRYTLGEKVLVTLINPAYILNNGYR
jgi:hypothetical protein